MPSIKVNDINMYYEVHGVGDPLVLIGGLGTDTEIWAGVLAHLAQHYQVIIFDNRGAGQTQTTQAPYSTEQLAQDTVSLMELLEIDQAHIVGHSLGSAVAQMIALNYSNKVNKLIICGTFDKLSQVSYLAVENSSRMMQAGVPMQILFNNNIPWIYSNAFIADAKKMAHLCERTLNHPNPQTVKGMQGQADAVLNHDTRDCLEQIKHPTLIIAGDEDIITPAKQAKAMALKMKDAECVVIEETAHLFIVEKPDEFSKIILKFLS